MTVHDLASRRKYDLVPIAGRLTRGQVPNHATVKGLSSEARIGGQVLYLHETVTAPYSASADIRLDTMPEKVRCGVGATRPRGNVDESRSGGDGMKYPALRNVVGT